MKNWTIAKRISIGFASVILITVALGMFSLSRLMNIRDHSNHISQQSLPGLN